MKTVGISVGETEIHVLGVGQMEYAAEKDCGTAVTIVMVLWEQMDIMDASLNQVNILKICYTSYTIICNLIAQNIH